MASLNPAKSVHIDDVCGQIREGYDADFIVLDQNLDLVATYLDGVKRYQTTNGFKNRRYHSLSRSDTRGFYGIHGVKQSVGLVICQY